jgi:two-component system, cell cycle sensor histidine kinase and response regulator CckA
LLERLGFEVTRAVDGLDAIEKGTGQLSILRAAVLDVSMPGRNGREVAEALRRSRADLPIVFVSGFPSDDVIDSLQDGKTLFLAKPFLAEDLQRALEQALVS